MAREGAIRSCCFLSWTRTACPHSLLHLSLFVLGRHVRSLSEIMAQVKWPWANSIVNYIITEFYVLFKPGGYIGMLCTLVIFYCMAFLKFSMPSFMSKILDDVRVMWKLLRWFEPLPSRCVKVLGFVTPSRLNPYVRIMSSDKQPPSIMTCSQFFYNWATHVLTYFSFQV